MNNSAIEGELRLFLEELCSDLCRIRHVEDDGIPPEQINVGREVQLAGPNSFADIVVTAPGAPAYFVEIKYGLSLEETVRSVRRKYAVNHRATCNRLVVVTRDIEAAALQSRLRDCVCTSLDIEVWDEKRLFADLDKYYGVKIEALTPDNIAVLHHATLQSNWKKLFIEDYRETLASALFWHFSRWSLKWLRENENLGPNDIWRPGSYSDVAILMADLSGFSRYVHDTRDDRVVQQILTAFYSQSRHAVHEYGGMFYQFVGDEVVALFGYPVKRPGYFEDALNCAKALLDIGASTSAHWERQIDLVQDTRGLHIGIAIGELNLMPLRPFAHSHIGFIGNELNLTARLLADAAAGEILISNAFYQGLDEDRQAEFAETGPLDAKNIGKVRGWRRAAER